MAISDGITHVIATPHAHPQHAFIPELISLRREEMQAGMRELLGELGGSRASRVAMLAGITRAELDSVGGAGEDD